MDRAASTSPGRRLRVLQSFRRPRPTTNPYLVQLLRCMPDDVEVTTFSWPAALWGRYDVFHVHWPEILLRGTTRTRTALRLALVLVLLTRWRLAGTAVVRTQHNTAPHETRGRLEQRVLAAIDRRTAHRILLQPDPGADADSSLVPHGHYRDWFADADVPPSVPGRLAFVGLIRPYKGVLDLLEVFGRTRESLPGASLEVAGAVPSHDLRGQVERAARDDDRVVLTTRHLSDDELAAAVGHATVVALPYREMGNSGVALLALSLDRPVLVPRTPMNADLADEVGPGWVLMYDPPLEVDDLVGLPSTPPSEPPRLDARAWSTCGRLHRQAYERALEARRGSR